MATKQKILSVTLMVVCAALFAGILISGLLVNPTTLGGILSTSPVVLSLGLGLIAAVWNSSTQLRNIVDVSSTERDRIRARLDGLQRRIYLYFGLLFFTAITSISVKPLAEEELIISRVAAFFAVASWLITVVRSFALLRTRNKIQSLIEKINDRKFDRLQARETREQFNPRVPAPRT